MASPTLGSCPSLAMKKPGQGVVRALRQHQTGLLGEILQRGQTVDHQVAA